MAINAFGTGFLSLYDIVGSLALLLGIAALINLIILRKWLNGSAAFWWIIGILLLPLIGSLGWFFAGRREALKAKRAHGIEKALENYSANQNAVTQGADTQTARN